MRLVSELAEVLEQILEIEAEVDQLLSGLPVEALTSRPNRGSWSIVEILVHLKLTADHCLPSLDLGKSSRYPQPGSIACEVLERFTDSCGRARVRISTAKPWGVETVHGETEKAI